MAKYITFMMPCEAFEGTDWIFDLAFGKENDFRRFVVVTAKNAEEAKKKYYHKHLLSDYYDRDDVMAKALLYAYLIHQDLEEDEVIGKFSENDGKILWRITSDYYEQGFDDNYYENLSGYEFDNKYYYDERIKEVSEPCLEELCFGQIYMYIGVSKIISEIK